MERKVVLMKASKICPYCNHPVVLTSNKELYGKEYGNGKCYLCRNCKASVGTHPGGKKPLGIIATREMKILKKACHELFDSSWKSHRISRSNAYKKLAELLNIRREDCHFGHFKTDMLLKALAIVSKPKWWRDGEKKL